MLANAKWRTSVAQWHERERSRLVSLLYGCGRRRNTHSGSGTKASNIYRGRGLAYRRNRMSGEKKYYLANCPSKTDCALAATIKARWSCAQARR